MKNKLPDAKKMLCALGVLLVFLTPVFAGRVLFLSSYSPSWRAVQLQLKGIESTFEHLVSVDYLFMDSKDIPSSQSEGWILDQYLGNVKIKGPYDAIILGDDAALDFILKYKKEYFDTIPLVFEGINDKEKALAVAKKYANITGVIETFSIEQILTVAHSLYPKAKRVLAICDETLSGEGSVKQYLAVKDRFPTLDFELLDTSLLSRTQIEKQLEACNGDTILLFLIFSNDANGTIYNLDEGTSLLMQNLSIPVFKVNETAIEDGYIGGKVISYSRMAALAARMVLDILQGKSVESIPVRDALTYNCYNRKVLDRFGFKKSQFPSDSLFLNDDGTFFSTHEVPLLGFSALVLVFLIVLLSLLRRSKVLVHKLTASEQTLQTAIEQSPLYVCEYDIQEKKIFFGKKMRQEMNLPEMLEDFPHSWLNLGLLEDKFVGPFCELMQKLEKGVPEVSMDIKLNIPSLGQPLWNHIVFKTVSFKDGHPSRAICVLSDISIQKQQEAEFEREIKRWNLLSEKTLLTLKVDVTAGTILDCYYAEILGPLDLFDSTYAKFYLNIYRFVHGDDKVAFEEIFAPEHLLEKYTEGERLITLRYRRMLPDGRIIWVTSVSSLVADFTTKHVVAFIRLYDVNDEEETKLLINRISNLDYDFFLLMDSQTGRTRKFMNDGKPLKGDKGEFFSFEEIWKWFEQRFAPTEWDNIKNQLSLDIVKKILSKQERYIVTFTSLEEKDALLRKRLSFAYLDESHLRICCLCQDFTEVVKRDEVQKQKLEFALGEAEKANAFKSEFLARMSHEMRTPLNAIIGLANLGLTDSRDSVACDYFKKIDTAGEYLLGLITDVLDMSRIESAGIELHPEDYYLSEFLNALSTIIGPQCVKKDILFLTIIKGKMNTNAYVDKMRFTQVFINLLSNAVKFSPHGGTVTLTMRTEQMPNKHNRMIFVIADNGCGMSKEFQKRVFLPFSQERIGKNSTVPGTGLGLAIVKNIVQLMGGTISMESELDKGSSFTLTFETIWTGEEKKEVFVPLVSVDYSLLKGKRVLIAEDHPLNAEIARKILSRQEITSELAGDGQIAITMFKESAIGYYDAILMDIRMPNIDGIEATRQIRALKRDDATSVPIIAMTANAFVEDVNECLDCGMNGHLSKPIDPSELFDMLAKELINTTK
ncbi:MAG: ABC transporter substrate binding protein, partial [Sphaerochaetaceae bacterium]